MKPVRGFTLIELLLTMGIVSVIFAITSIILSNIIPRANLNLVEETFKAEIRQQQLQAMTGEKDSTDQAVEYGVMLDTNHYSLFPGITYSPLPSDSYTTQVPENIEFTTTFANSVLIFDKGSGEVLNYDENNNQIIITDTSNNETKVLIFNRYGIPE